MYSQAIEKAKDKFSDIAKEQIARVERMKIAPEIIDYSGVSPIVIGLCFGDGIGIEISRHAQVVIKHLLKKEIQENKIVFKDIAGLTIENRVKHNKAIPDDVLAELKS